MSKPFLGITTGDPSLLTKNVTYDDIHPVMPRVIQGELWAMCERSGVSFNDRERLYNHLKSLGRELAMGREW